MLKTGTAVIFLSDQTLGGWSDTLIIRVPCQPSFWCIPTLLTAHKQIRGRDYLSYPGKLQVANALFITAFKAPSWHRLHRGRSGAALGAQHRRCHAGRPAAGHSPPDGGGGDVTTSRLAPQPETRAAPTCGSRHLWDKRRKATAVTRARRMRGGRSGAARESAEAAGRSPGSAHIRVPRRRPPPAAARGLGGAAPPGRASPMRVAARSVAAGVRRGAAALRLRSPPWCRPCRPRGGAAAACTGCTCGARRPRCAAPATVSTRPVRERGVTLRGAGGRKRARSGAAEAGLGPRPALGLYSKVCPECCCVRWEGTWQACVSQRFVGLPQKRSAWFVYRHFMS